MSDKMTRSGLPAALRAAVWEPLARARASELDLAETEAMVLAALEAAWPAALLREAVRELVEGLGKNPLLAELRERPCGRCGKPGALDLGMAELDVCKLCYRELILESESTPDLAQAIEDAITDPPAAAELELAASLEAARLRAALDLILAEAHHRGGEDALSCLNCHEVLGLADEALAAPPPAGLEPLRELLAAVQNSQLEELRDPYNAALAAYPALAPEGSQPQQEAAQRAAAGAAGERP